MNTLPLFPALPRPRDAPPIPGCVTPSLHREYIRIARQVMRERPGVDGGTGAGGGGEKA